MPECGAVSTFCEGDTCWTYTCTRDDTHAPGDHDYQLDDGQTPPPEA